MWLDLGRGGTSVLAVLEPVTRRSLTPTSSPPSLSRSQMQLGLCDVSTLILGPKLVARTSTDSTSARSPTLPPSVEPIDLGKDDKKVRILGSFDFDGAAAKTYRCA